MVQRVQLLDQKFMVLLILLMFFIIAFPSYGSMAQDDYYSIDVLVLMDCSGSTRRTDPDGLRFKAFEDLVMQLDVGDRIGLFQFGTTSVKVFPLTEIYDDSSRYQLGQHSIPRDNLGYTNVKDVMEDGYQEMLSNYDSEHLPFFILFTDGEINPSRSYATDRDFRNQYLVELLDLTEKYISKGWPVFFVNLNVDNEPVDPVLEQIAHTTGGYTVDVKSAYDITKTFSDILESIREIKQAAEEEIKHGPKEDAGAVLRVTSPDAGDYTLLSSLEIHGEIAVDGRRAYGGNYSELDIWEIYVVIEKPNGETTRIELSDDGDVIRGDMKKDDGIYSAFYRLDMEGYYKVTVFAEGEYQGEPFEFSKVVEGIRAAPAARVILSAVHDEGVILYPGRKRNIVLEADVESFRTERVEFILTTPDTIAMEPSVHYLLNRNDNKITLEVFVPKDLPVGQQGELVIEVLSQINDTIVIPARIRIPYTVEASKILDYVLLTLTVIVILANIFLLCLFIKRKAVVRSFRLKGKLSFWYGENKRKKQFIKLRKYRKNRIRLSSKLDEDVDTLIPTREEIDIKIYSEKNNNRINYYVTGGIDNILYIDGVPHKTILLENELKFNIKSFNFQYHNPKMKFKKKYGVNVLDKYDI